MSVGAAQVGEMDTLFHSYNLLHDSFRAELQVGRGGESGVVNTRGRPAKTGDLIG